MAVTAGGGRKERKVRAEGKEGEERKKNGEGCRSWLRLGEKGEGLGLVGEKRRESEKGKGRKPSGIQGSGKKNEK